MKVDQVQTPPLALFGARALRFGAALFGSWRLLLLPFLLVGLLRLPLAGLLAVGTSVLLLAAYVAQAHVPLWIVYYLEAQPVFAFVVALGVAHAARAAARAGQRLRGAQGLAALERVAAGVAAALLVVSLAGAALGARSVLGQRLVLALASHGQQQFRDDVDRLPEPRVIVFVRYGATHRPFLSLVNNSGDLARAHAWLVHDRGDDNRRLLDRVPDRAAYRYDEDTGRFERLRAASLAGAPPTTAPAPTAPARRM
jgi:hypothetical protein